MRKTLAVVIKTADFKDNDRMVTLLTKDYGKMSAKVRGAKKQTSKLFFASSLFCCGEYGFYEKNNFFGIKSFHIKYSFAHLQNDYDMFSAACFIADTVNAIAQEDFEAPKLFALTVNALYALDNEQVSWRCAVGYYIQRLLFIEGIYPSLEACVFCGRVNELTRFSHDHGGVVCAVCAKNHGGTYVDREVISALLDMREIMPRDMGKVSFDKRIEKKLTRVLVEYLEHTLGKPLKSSRFIKDAL